MGMKKLNLSPLHPGEVLREEFLEPHGLSAYAVAKACGVPRTRIERLSREEIGVSGDSAVRLSAFFGTSPEFWMNLQSRFELEVARGEIATEVDKIKPYEAATA
jgi:addiction module HigA family antidote